MNDYDVVIMGVKNMLDDFPDRVRVVELARGGDVAGAVDVALCDSFAHDHRGDGPFAAAIRDPIITRTVMYSWDTAPMAVDAAMRRGFSGFLSKSLSADELVCALERIVRGERVVETGSGHPDDHSPLGWPGKENDLTERESEVVALITAGCTNAEIARMTFLSINSVKTNIRHAYRKMGVTTRSQAVLWGIDHGFRREGRSTL